MKTETRNRREFLLGAGVTIGSAALGSRLFAATCAISPGLIAPHSDSEPVDFPAAALHLGADRSAQPEDAVLPKMRGLMVDAGRLPETLDYYRRVIDYCAEWKLNTLHFRLADDQGSALRFTSVPHLVLHKNAFAPEQLKALAEHAQTRGVDLIPELESFGHTGYITRSPAYSHLLDSQTQGPSEFTGVIPVHPETLLLFNKLYREVAAIFPSIYLHGGCDEVNWGGSELSRQALKTKSRAEIWAEYLNSLHQICVGLGKQLIVWGDFVVHKEPEILPQVNKNIIIMDWDYQEHDSARVRETIRKVASHGLRAIGAPALVNYRWGPRVGTEQLRNIEAFADAYLGEEDPNSLGVILTNWIPCRYVQNSIWDGFFYAAVAFNEGTAAARSSAFRRFVENHYGAMWSDLWSEAFQTIYDVAPSIQKRSTVSGPGLQLRAPWSSDAQLAAVLQIASPIQNPFTRLRSLLGQLEPAVHKNLSDFQAFALSVEALQRLFWRESVVIDEAAKKPLDRKSTDQLIASIRDSDRALARALSKDWDKGRFPDSLAKSELVFGLQPKDQLLFEWMRAADSSALLAGNPERFHQLLAAAKPA